LVVAKGKVKTKCSSCKHNPCKNTDFFIFLKFDAKGKENSFPTLYTIPISFWETLMRDENMSH